MKEAPYSNYRRPSSSESDSSCSDLFAGPKTSTHLDPVTGEVLSTGHDVAGMDAMIDKLKTKTRTRTNQPVQQSSLSKPERSNTSDSDITLSFHPLARSSNRNTELPPPIPSINGIISKYTQPQLKIDSIDEIVERYNPILKRSVRHEPIQNNNTRHLSPVRDSSTNSSPSRLRSVSENSSDSNSSINSLTKEALTLQVTHSPPPRTSPQNTSPIHRYSPLKQFTLSSSTANTTTTTTATTEEQQHQQSSSSSSSQNQVEDQIALYLRSTRLTTLIKLKRQQSPMTVSLADVGSPTGHPVFIFLGLGCVRYLIGLYDELATALGLRLICIDRWGLGKTTSVTDEQRGFLEWGIVVEEVADQLSIQKFSILAHSAGAPYGLATSLRLGARIHGSIHLLAPWVSLTAENGMHAGNYKWLKYVPNSMIKSVQAAEWKMTGWRLGKPPTIVHHPIGFNINAPVESSTSTDHSDQDLECSNSQSTIKRGLSIDSGLITNDTIEPSSKPQSSNTLSTNSYSARLSSSSSSSTTSSSHHHHHQPSSSNGSHQNSKGEGLQSTKKLSSSPIQQTESNPTNNFGTFRSFRTQYKPSVLPIRRRYQSTTTPSSSSNINQTPTIHNNNNNLIPSSCSSASFPGSCPTDDNDQNQLLGIDPYRDIDRESVDLFYRKDLQSLLSGRNDCIQNPNEKMKSRSTDSISKPKSNGKDSRQTDNNSLKTMNHQKSNTSNESRSSSSTSSMSEVEIKEKMKSSLGISLLRASYSESLKGGTSDLITILEKNSKPWGFSYSEIDKPVKIWHGSKDERLSYKGSQWLINSILNQDVKDQSQLLIIDNATHSLMTDVNVLYQVFESIADQW
ncbi:hypothetical protein MJO28_004387 [Puccinia striiformis f. sp. tritici]|uniref:AB hydrolase-1 domain-containing protein n=2 Tax=Puccinia striiformis TaxID=27350 RepID=A0A2S4UIB7_9BASI|nr:hypothetical protein MJO28_004387 [Puccinia striiformis f. sp. tritici]POV97035.1 hypothetical protein PSTT_15309 [Puccinia striiformis]